MRWGRCGAVCAAALAVTLGVACGDEVSPAGEDSSRVVRWQASAEGADGMLATADVLYVVGPEVITAFDTRSGSVLWQSEMSDTSGVTPMSLEGDVVVVAPEFEAVQAFDARTGEPEQYIGRPPIMPYDDFQLPYGYHYLHGALTLNGHAIWEGGDLEHRPQVGRLGEMTIVNDFDDRLTIVADDGEVLFHARGGDAMWDESAVLVDEEHGVAFTLTADGRLWAIQAP